jgi:ribose 5-phosphate isomerase B
MHSLGESLAIVDAFLAAEWSNEERHQRRIDTMSQFEETGVAPALAEA